LDADQARMARAALKLGVREIAAAAKVSPNTVTRLEAGLPVNSSTVAAIRAALEAAGVEFIAENGGGAGVRLRKGAPPAFSVEDLKR
jgi:transcriptional regulator with XRE-family HTH domain